MLKVRLNNMRFCNSELTSWSQFFSDFLFRSKFWQFTSWMLTRCKIGALSPTFYRTRVDSPWRSRGEEIVITFFEVIFSDGKIWDWFSFDWFKFFRFDFMKNKFLFNHILFVFFNWRVELFIDLRGSFIVNFKRTVILTDFRLGRTWIARIYLFDRGWRRKGLMVRVPWQSSFYFSKGIFFLWKLQLIFKKLTT